MKTFVIAGATGCLGAYLCPAFRTERLLDCKTVIPLAGTQRLTAVFHNLSHQDGPRD